MNPTMLNVRFVTNMQYYECLHGLSLLPLLNEFFFLGKSLAAKTWFLDPSKEGELIDRIHQQSYRAFRELGLQDFAVFDFRVDREGNTFFLECNLFCSFGQQSVVNVIAKNSGITDENLFDMMVENSLLRRKK